MLRACISALYAVIMGLNSKFTWRMSECMSTDWVCLSLFMNVIWFSRCLQVTQQHSKIQSIQKCTNPNFRAHGLSRCFHSFFDFSGNLRLLWGLNYNVNFHDAHILQTSQKEEGATTIIFSMFFSISGNTTITGVRHRGRGKNNQ